MRSHTAETRNHSASPEAQRRESCVSTSSRSWEWGGRQKKKNLMAMNQTGVQRRNPSDGMCGGWKRRQTETNWEADVTITNTLANAITQNSLGRLCIAIKTLYLSVTSLSLSPSLLLPILLWDQRLVARKKSKLLYLRHPKHPLERQTLTSGCILIHRISQPGSLCVCLCVCVRACVFVCVCISVSFFPTPTKCVTLVYYKSFW